ncbi:MAG TPA: hypothetical protein VN893_14095, partial [Bryobacteraceae bacterium]|nr:hypothetical protein [Bryobacteraceae bacterium]
MIAPRTRLLVLAAVVVVPLAFIAGLAWTLAPVCVAVVGAVCGFVAWDAGRGMQRIGALRVRLPALVRATRGVETRLPVDIIHSGGTAVEPQVALRLPQDLVSERVVETVAAGSGV